MKRWKRWLVTFRSHAVGEPADVTCASVYADHGLEAVSFALVEAPPAHRWAVATVEPWPRGMKCPSEALAAA